MTTLHLKKSMARSRLRLGFFLAELALTCFALSPMLQAQDQNTALGFQTLDGNTTGDKNTAIGYRAMRENRTGSENTATGFQALPNNTTGNKNTANGVRALFGNTTGNDNTANGVDALHGNTTGNRNTAIGINALSNNAADNNTALGRSTLQSNTIGSDNTGLGLDALFGNTTGNFNTVTGRSALSRNTTGTRNTALGFFAGFNATTGSNNVYIGANMRGIAGETQACYIASIFGQTSATGIPVLVNSTNKLGTATSSKRFKEDIKPMDTASEALFSLKPVSFRYKKDIDPAGTSQLGLVAEDVEKVNPDLVVRDKEGNPYSVRYEQVNAMLLNEFLKEHRKVEELAKEFQTTVAQQQKQIEALTTGLQKVSEQIEASKSAPQVVNNR
jgi:hypothetical protein